MTHDEWSIKDKALDKGNTMDKDSLSTNGAGTTEQPRAKKKKLI